MEMERLREITERVGKLSSGERIYVTFIAGTEKLWLSVKSTTDERYEKINEIIAEYKDEILVVENHRVPSSDLDREYLEQIDFIDLFEKMAYGIEADIKALIENPPMDPIYAFVVGLSPEHDSMENNANTESEWEKHKIGYKGSKIDITKSDKYWSPEFSLEHPLAKSEFWAPLYEAFGKVEAIKSKHHNLTNGESDFSHIYERRLTQMGIHALKKNMHLFDDLSTTEDFVTYVQDPVGNGDDMYTALETMSFERAIEIYSMEPIA